MSFVVGLHGAKGSGKDTLAKIVAPAFKGVIWKFADPLYAMANTIDPQIKPSMSHELKESPLLNMEELGTRRNFLQKLGTELARDMIHPDLWVIKLANRYEGLRKANDKIVFITDVRMPNEAEWVRRNGILIRLEPDWETYAADHVTDKKLPSHYLDGVIHLKKGKPSLGAAALMDMVIAAREIRS